LKQTLYEKYCDKIREYIELDQPSLVPEKTLAKTDSVAHTTFCYW